MAPSDVCPTEDAVQAFLEHLVDPLLPAKSSIRDNPTLSHQQSVAKQVHSIVLLYNYYHRKQHPELEYLPFNEFCKLVVVLRPTLLAYMQFMQKFNETELTDVEKQLSLTEKMVMNACDVCKCLEASKNVHDINGWPILKVAVLLIDSKKEYCFLIFGSITRGVWSVVEKDLDASSQSSEFTSGTKYTYKRKRVIRKPIKDKLNVDEAGFLHVGYSAVKEAAGINNTDLTLLESYTVYSQNKEKAASRFYIMQCSPWINQEVIQVPLKDLIESLQGPLVKKSSSSWTITPVVNYFHVLPYSEIISEWISREAFSNSLQDSRIKEKSIMVDNTEVTEPYVSEDTFIGLDIKPSSNNIVSPKPIENNESCTLKLSGSIKEPSDMDVGVSSIFQSPNKEKCQYNANTAQVDENQEKNNPYVQYKSNGSPSTVEAMKVDSTRMLITEGGVNNCASCQKICAERPRTSSVKEKDIEDECTLITNHSNSDLEKLQILLDSKGKILSQTALTALIRKRNGLALQQRKIEDEIAICDKKIERMLTDGKDDVMLKIESIIDSYNDIWERTCKHETLSPCIKRRKLSEAVLFLPSPCQELDDVCRLNNWIPPTCHLTKSDGGFLADITVKGVDFECRMVAGDVCSSPGEARESAAAQVLTSLRSMAKLTSNA